jgi:hypothetical protein
MFSNGVVMIYIYYVYVYIYIYTDIQYTHDMIYNIFPLLATFAAKTLQQPLPSAIWWAQVVLVA